MWSQTSMMPASTATLFQMDPQAVVAAVAKNSKLGKRKRKVRRTPQWLWMAMRLITRTIVRCASKEERLYSVIPALVLTTWFAWTQTWRKPQRANGAAHTVKKRAFSGKQRRITLKVRKSWRMLWGMLRKRMTTIWNSVESAKTEESCCAVMPVLHPITSTV
ncbi:hypothetical protein N320_11322 [Buceros rhinoceros silvestris]|nr:hypothetical protein N320_11322 [Buceros rhinoceros silvestris]